MAKVRVEILPWLSEKLQPGTTGRFILEAEGATLEDLFHRLAAERPDFEVVFDPASFCLREYIQVLLNDHVVAWLAERNALLKNGDCVLLLPANSGG